MKIDINVNDMVQCQLTPQGEEMWLKYAPLTKFGKTKVLRVPMWELMFVLGPAMWLGMSTPIKNNTITFDDSRA